MIIDLLSDININVSSNYADANLQKIKGYPSLNTSLAGNSINDKYLKFHFLDQYKFSSLTINLTAGGTFGSYRIYYSTDNINWTLIEDSLTVDSLTLTFSEVTAAYLKLEFVNLTSVTVASLLIPSESSDDNYTDHFRLYRKNEMKEILPKKLYEGTDIETLFENWLEL